MCNDLYFKNSNGIIIHGLYLRTYLLAVRISNVNYNNLYEYFLFDLIKQSYLNLRFVFSSYFNCTSFNNSDVHTCVFSRFISQNGKFRIST